MVFRLSKNFFGGIIIFVDTVTIKGIEYQKASLLAKKLKYTPDYIGQLCRANKVKAKLVGRTWYVNLDSLLEYKKTRYSDQKPAVKKGVKKSAEKKLSAKVVTKPEKTKQEFTGNKVKISFGTEGVKSRLAVEPPVKANTVKIFRTNESYSSQEPVKPERKNSEIFYKSDDADLLPKITKLGLDEEKKNVIHLSLLKNAPKKKDKEVLDEVEETVVVPIKSIKKPTKLTSAGLPTVFLKGKIAVSSAEKKFEIEDADKVINIKKITKEDNERREALKKIITSEQVTILNLDETKLGNDEGLDLENKFEDFNNKLQRKIKVTGLEDDEVEEEEKFDLKSLAKDYQKKLSKDNAEFVSVSVTALKPRSIQEAQLIKNKIKVLKIVSWSLIVVLALVLLISLFVETEISTGGNTKIIFSLPKF